MQDLTELLRSNPYPGRGIVVGKDVVYYWIMGRSSNSRNRAVMEIETDIFSKRVEKHNTLIERTYRLEQDMAVMQHDVQSLAERSE